MIGIIPLIVTILCIVFIPVLFFFLLYRVSIFVYTSFSLSYKKGLVLTFFSLCATFFPSLLPSASHHIKICSIGSWQISIHPIGFLFPVLISIILLYKAKPNWIMLLLGLIPVSIMAFFISTPIIDKGIVSSFPFWLFPAIMAALITVLNKEKLGKYTSLSAFFLGVFGIIFGADLGHFPHLLSIPVSSSMNAILGGASGGDLIFLSGMIAVLLTRFFLFFNEISKQYHFFDAIHIH